MSTVRREVGIVLAGLLIFVIVSVGATFLLMTFVPPDPSLDRWSWWGTYATKIAGVVIAGGAMVWIASRPPRA
ncbi:MAG: hypothetical protein EA378_09695 [Phycisphaerales bacterium]|nr:MAG: hypothetical protein EA378_09695 [Phycisphaerales bacterium]